MPSHAQRTGSRFCGVLAPLGVGAPQSYVRTGDRKLQSLGCLLLCLNNARTRGHPRNIPSPHTIAATSAPRPGTQLSSTRPSATLSQPPSSFSIRTSLFASISSVWNAPSFTCWFSSATRPATSTVALAVGAVLGVPLVVPDSAPGGAEGAQVTRVTASVRCRRIRFESTDPVVETFCTRRIPAARTRSPCNGC